MDTWIIVLIIVIVILAVIVIFAVLSNAGMDTPSPGTRPNQIATDWDYLKEHIEDE